MEESERERERDGDHHTNMTKAFQFQVNQQLHSCMVQVSRRDLGFLIEMTQWCSNVSYSLFMHVDNKWHKMHHQIDFASIEWLEKWHEWRVRFVIAAKINFNYIILHFAPVLTPLECDLQWTNTNNNRTVHISFWSDLNRFWSNFIIFQNMTGSSSELDKWPITIINDHSRTKNHYDLLHFLLFLSLSLYLPHLICLWVQLKFIMRKFSRSEWNEKSVYEQTSNNQVIECAHRI